MKMTGKVWLVGAGPGDIGLLTLKGKRVLDEADVVVYDSLVGDGVLAMIPDSARLINVGKRASNHIMPQEQINQVLANEAKKGNKVVRLKGGDPFLFGRGGEELEVLSAEGVRFEVVPGVTSSLAVPAYNGIPVTHRDFVSSLHIVTGHKRAGQEYDIDFDALVRTQGTLIFLMGIAALHDICSNLISAGIDVNMPAAVLQQGTTAGQKRVVATVSTLEDEVARQGIETPAIIVVGEVCKLSQKFGWYEKLPLSGKKILVTRPRKLISQMSHKLRVQGAEVLELPAISTDPIPDNSQLKSCINNISEYNWIVFTSPSGVDIFFDQAMDTDFDVRMLVNTKIAVIGQGSRKALLKYGIKADLMPEVYDGKHLGEAIALSCQPGDKILIPRAAIGNQELIDEINKKEGVKVVDVATYDTNYIKYETVNQVKQFKDGKIDLTVFTSASTVRAFVEATPGLDYSVVNAACIGKQTKTEADSYGMKTFMSDKATMDSLVELAINILK